MNIINRIINYFHFRLLALLKPLSETERQFIEVNKAFWGRYKAQENVRTLSDGVIFVHFELYPTSLLGMLTIASMLAYDKGLRIVVISPSVVSNSVNSILRSFPRVTLEYEDTQKFFYLRIKSFISAMLSAIAIRSPEQLLAFRIKGIQVGDTLYDSILAKGFATVSSIKYWQIVEVLSTYNYSEAKVKHILNKYEVVCGEAVHIVGAAGSAFLRNLLANGKPVYICAAAIKKYQSLNMMHECWETPDPRYINWMLKNKDYFLPLADIALTNRMENTQLEHYSKTKIVYTERSEFYNDFKLNNKKRNVFVMLHAFNDWPHTYGDMIYMDFYQWFSDILDIAKKTDNVNWVFKNHPYARYYKTDVDVHEVFRSINFPHIRYMAEDVNFNTSSIRYVGDVVITCLGTAGLEYSAFGIPCVLAAKNWYSGQGFTIEPKSVADYRGTLENLNSIEKLTNDKIEAAKLMSYFSFGIMNADNIPDPLRLHATHNMQDIKTMSDDDLIKVILNSRGEGSLMLNKEYLREIREFIDSDIFYQYIDFKLHPLNFNSTTKSD